MKNYTVGYDGTASRFKGFKVTVKANSEREAVEAVYADYLDQNYFPQDDGSIHDCNGDEISGADDDRIFYDGGYFNAEEVLENADNTNP